MESKHDLFAHAFRFGPVGEVQDAEQPGPARPSLPERRLHASHRARVQLLQTGQPRQAEAGARAPRGLLLVPLGEGQGAQGEGAKVGEALQRRGADESFKAVRVKAQAPGGGENESEEV